MIYNLLNKQKEKNVAVVFVGEDLDVLLALSDRLLVLSGGKIAGIVDARNVTKEEVGLLMLSRSNADAALKAEDAENEAKKAENAENEAQEDRK